MERCQFEVELRYFLVATIIYILTLFVFVLTVPYEWNGLPKATMQTMVAAVALLLSLIYLRNKSEYKIFNASKSDYREILTFGVPSGVALGILNYPSNVVQEDQIPDYITYVPLNNNLISIVVFLVLVTLVIPIVEELIFRGYVYNSLKRKTGYLWAFILTTLLFTILHNPQGYVKIAIGALLFTYIYEKTKRIETSILAHIITNTIWYGALYYNLNGIYP